MQLEIEIPKRTEMELDEASRITGMKRQEIINKALLHYAEELKKMVELKKEMKAWDDISDEDFEKFEGELWKGEKFG